MTESVSIKQEKWTEVFHLIACFILLFIAITNPLSSQAQEAETLAVTNTAQLNDNAQRVYRLDYFEQYAPVTASDMVEQIPNFVLSTVESKRGLGQGGINILINGARLSGKNNDASSALKRISATSVERIEILDGASLNIPGLSGTVANIITNQNSFSGSWKYRAEFQNRSRANLFGIEGSVSGANGPIEYSIGFTSEPFRDTELGPEVVVDAQGNIIEQRNELALAFEDNPKISGEFTYTASNGNIGHLNANYQKTNFRFDERSFQAAIAIAGTTEQRRSTFGDDGWNAEIGADYEFKVGAGNMKLIGISRYNESQSLDNLSTYDETGQTLESIFGRDLSEGETITRAEYSVAENENRDWQISVEGAYNFLESEAELSESNALGVLEVIPFPNSSSRVEEYRTEANITHNRKISDAVSMQASVGVEYSEISQTGPDGLTRDFVRPKGFISTTYTASDSLTIRGTIERNVGQLDFNTFISSVNLADDIGSAGNPLIVPAQSWDGELELEKKWENGLSGTLRIYGQHIDDLVDRIPLLNGGDAPGNIDNAKVIGIELVGTVLLDKIGLEGAKLDFEIEARDTNLNDPLSLRDRRFNNSLVSRYQIDFRHDIAGSDWAWGGTINNIRNSTVFRLTQTSHFTQAEPDIQLYIERKNLWGLTIRADVKNVTSTDYSLTRNLWSNGNRATGTFAGFEKRTRDAAPQYRLTVSGTF